MPEPHYAHIDYEPDRGARQLAFEAFVLDKFHHQSGEYEIPEPM
jgi:hypothetical protein